MMHSMRVVIKLDFEYFEFFMALQEGQCQIGCCPVTLLKVGRYEATTRFIDRQRYSPITDKVYQRDLYYRYHKVISENEGLAKIAIRTAYLKVTAKGINDSDVNYIYDSLVDKTFKVRLKGSY